MGYASFFGRIDKVEVVQKVQLEVDEHLKGIKWLVVVVFVATSKL
jgi:hypothetical protein